MRRILPQAAWLPALGLLLMLRSADAQESGASVTMPPQSAALSARRPDAGGLPVAIQPVTLTNEIAASYDSERATVAAAHAGLLAAASWRQSTAASATESQPAISPAGPAPAPVAPAQPLRPREIEAQDDLSLLPARNVLHQTVIALLTVVILLTGATYSSTFRLRLFIWQGDYARAAKVCERKLKRRPEDFKLYLTLANIYSALDRQDERAIDVYRKALRFDPATCNHGKMTSIIARYCRHEGEMDSEFWKVLGGALSA